jgi:GAF domain-containing protein
VEPVPESREALERLIDTGEEQFAAEVLRLGRRALEIVPECVGLSLAIMHYGLTFTLAATDEDIAGLDAVQYLDGGPCVSAAHDHARVEVEQDELFDEAQWQLYAQSSAAAGVRSSLTLPMLDESGTVISTVNLYASTPDAFEGREDLLAAALGATAAKAVANADLSFNTRLEAAAGPERLDEAMDVSSALGVIAESQNVDMATARERLRAAAARAGISEAQAARAVIGLHSP